GANLKYSSGYSVNFTDADLSQSDLAGSYYQYATLDNASLRQTNLMSADFGSSTLSNATLRQADLTTANFTGTTLTGADCTGAEVRGANFSRDDVMMIGTGISPAQLYSTVSYQAHNLTLEDPLDPNFAAGINLSGNHLANVNLAGQNMC